MARRRLTQTAPSASPALPRAPIATPPIAQVAGQSAEAAALQDMIDGLNAARAEGRMLVDVPLGDIAPDHLVRDRIARDPEANAALKASLAAHGQRTPVELTPLAPAADGTPPTHPYGLISGWRRLQALGELHAESGDPRFARVRALVRPPAAAGASYVAMVEENEVRLGLSNYERARIVAEAAARGVFPDRATALRTLFATASRAKRSKIASFIDIYEHLGPVLRFPTEIPERLGLALVSRLRQDGAAAIRAALEEAGPATAEAELNLLERLAAGAARPVQRRGPAATARRGSPAAPELEPIRPGLGMAAERKGQTLVVTLSGEAVDDGLLQTLRDALRRPG